MPDSMLTTRKLVFTAAVFLAGVLLMNLAFAYLTRNSVPRRVMQRARESDSATVLALGNSLVASGFDNAAFDAGAGLAAPRASVNLGLGATSPIEHLLLLRYALAHGMRPRLVLYGFYDFQLTDPGAFTTSDLIGNDAMVYYVEPSYARGFLTLSFHDAVDFRVMHLFPMLADRGAAWAKIEILRRDLAQQGMPPERSNQFGRVADFSLLEAASADDFRRQCESSLKLPLAPAVSELLRQASSAGAMTTVVEMPMRRAHRSQFYDTACWSQYVTRIGSLLEPYRANFTDASAWIQDDSLFEDPLHLSDAGAEQFSRRLGRTLDSKFMNLGSAPARDSR
jgi:hypothetical protein